MASFALTLDTQPPVIGWGFPYRDIDKIVIPYLISEPVLLAASVGRAVATIYPDRIEYHGDLPQGGQLHVKAHVIDDVLNQFIHKHVIWLQPQEGSVSKVVSGRSILGGPYVASRVGVRLPRRVEKPYVTKVIR